MKARPASRRRTAPSWVDSWVGVGRRSRSSWGNRSASAERSLLKRPALRSAASSSRISFDDAAAFLRLPEETVQRRAVLGEIPERQIEGSWRFLLSALEDWLRTPDQRSVLLSQAGALADDESLEELFAQIYAARGRPEVDPGAD